MKAWPFIILMAPVLVCCGHRDPIDRIVEQDSADPFFPTGMFTPIRLPATASAAEVASRALGQSGTNITVLETRQVQIHADSGLPAELVNFTAVLVNTTSGLKVVLLQFQKDSQNPPGGWWSRVYDL
jgi:hypothetical protein